MSEETLNVWEYRFLVRYFGARGTPTDEIAPASPGWKPERMSVTAGYQILCKAEKLGLVTRYKARRTARPPKRRIEFQLTESGRKHLEFIRHIL